MSKTKQPLFSLEAHGTVAESITFQRRRGVNFVREKPIPTDPRSDLQLDHRLFYRGVCYLWQALSLSEKNAYLSAARRYHISGFNLFMRGELSRLLHPYVLLPFAKGSGNTLFDYSGNSENATIFGASWRSGDYKPYLYFDGLNDKAQFGLCAADLGLSHTGNIEVKITPILTDYHILVDDYSIGPTAGLTLRINSDKTVTFLGYDDGLIFYSKTTYTLSTGDTHIIRAELTGSQAKLYINGVLRASAAQTGNVGVSSQNLGIGYYPRLNSTWFKGDYHYLVIYPYA